MNTRKTAIHIHHIASHFTSSMFPVASLLLTMYYLKGGPAFEAAAFYCVIFGSIAAPFVYGSGVADWKTRFKSRHTPIFDQKIIYGVVFIMMAIAIIALRVMWPDVADGGGPYSIAYLIMVYVATGLAAYLGHLGSKFI